MVKKEGNSKLKIAVIISIISVLIALISLGFSFYTGIKDVEYKDTIKRIQLGSQDIQKNSILFEENYKKVELAQQNLFDRMNNCEKVNKYELTNNLKLMSGARNALINNDPGIVSSYLNEINLNKICTETNAKKTYIEITILSLVWAVLILSLIIILARR